MKPVVSRVCASVVAAVATLATPIAQQPTGFVAIAGGRFTMGADRARDPQAFDNERWSPAVAEGTVDLPTFYIARQPVTTAEYAAFVAARRWPADRRALAGGPSQPVTFVSWPDALAYCRWLEHTMKGQPGGGAPGPGWRITLPSEAEWEKAARLADRSQFAWGALAEWTRSPYQPYPYDERDDRTQLQADALWVIRGAIGGDQAVVPRATARTGADPGARRAFIGFRVVITPPR